MSLNIHNDVANHYYSGQGVVMIAQRNADGSAGALIPIGNVSSLKIMIANSVTDHKGAQDGQRAVDKRLVTETKGSVSIDLENLISTNLALALRGKATTVASGTVTAAADIGYVGAVTNLPNIGIAGLTTGAGLTVAASQASTAGTLTEYTAPGVAYDYTWNADAGSFAFNNPAVSGVNTVALGIPLTAGSGATTTAGLWAVTALSASPAQYLVAGDTVTVMGVTGGTGNSINGLVGTVTAASATTLSVQFAASLANQAGMVLTAARVVPVTKLSTGGLPYPINVTCTYTYSAYNYTDALVTAPQEMYLRFEGLNTTESLATGNPTPVVVEVFRFSVDPMKELDLINDAFAKLTIEGAIMSDPTKTTGSKFFKVYQLN